MSRKRLFTNLSQVEEAFKLALIDTINNEVFDVVRDELLEEMQARVYDTYTPRTYERRGRNKGLADPNNIVISKPVLSDNQISFLIENITKGNGDAVGELINEFIEGKEGFAGDPSTGMPARPYTEYAYSNLVSSASRNTMKQALETGLRRRGFNVKIR